MNQLDDILPKSPYWWRKLDELSLDSVPLGPNCSHEAKTEIRWRVHCYGEGCRPVQETTFKCDDCGTIICYTE